MCLMWVSQPVTQYLTCGGTMKGCRWKHGPIQSKNTYMHTLPSAENLMVSSALKPATTPTAVEKIKHNKER